MDAEDFVKSSLGAGKTHDEVARSLIEERHLEAIPAIKALRSGADIPLGEAKDLIHRNLPAEQQEAAEQLWEAASASLDHDDD